MFAAHAFQPATDMAEGSKREAALLRDMSVGIERDVGDRTALGTEPVMLGQMRIHHR
jgi:hypothetical protein